MDDSPHHLDEGLPVVGKADSFEDFFRGEYRDVLGLAYVLSGSWPTAEELTMDAFEVAFRDWPRIARLDKPGAWVRKVVSNAAVSRFRRLGAARRAAERMADDARLDDSREGAEVWDAVRRLPTRQAQVTALTYLSGYARAEVADLLGISEESVKTHLERARRRLAIDLGESDAG
jgi:RNA polymerase sigma-70 factor (ECF subfamily)